MKTNKHFLPSPPPLLSVDPAERSTVCSARSRNRFWCLSVSEKRAAAAEENDHKILKKNIFSLSLFSSFCSYFLSGFKNRRALEGTFNVLQECSERLLGNCSGSLRSLLFFFFARTFMTLERRKIYWPFSFSSSKNSL
jgi:hypothetical protein